MQHQLDSLMPANEENERELAELSSFMEVVSLGLDSLSIYDRSVCPYAKRNIIRACLRNSPVRFII